MYREDTKSVHSTEVTKTSEAGTGEQWEVWRHSDGRASAREEEEINDGDCWSSVGLARDSQGAVKASEPFAETAQLWKIGLFSKRYTRLFQTIIARTRKADRFRVPCFSARVVLRWLIKESVPH